MTVGRESVTYRLAVTGDDDVTRRFAKIAETGESSAKRLGRAYERDLRLAEASVERLQRRAEALNTLGGSAVQQRIAGATGLDRSLAGSGDAERSMAVFIRQQDELAQARSRLLTQSDPLFAAQQRYNQIMAEAVRLDRQGALAKGDLTRVTTAARQELQLTNTTYEAATKLNGAYRVGIQQAGFQVSDFAVQVGGGTSAIRAAALQGPQFIQALALMGSGAENATGRFAAMTRLLAGPWGAAITVGVSVLGAFAATMDRGKKQTNSLTDAIDFQKMSIKEVTKALRDQRIEAEKAIQTSAALEIQNRNQARSELEKAIATRTALAAKLEEAKANLALAEQTRQFGDKANLNLLAPGIRRDGINSDIASNDRQIEQARGLLFARQFAVSQSEAAAALDPATRAQRKYNLAVSEFENIARKRGLTDAQVTEGLTQLARARDAEIARIKESTRSGVAGTRAQARAERDRQRFVEQNIDSVRALSEASSPLLAIANTLKDELAEINRLAGVSAAEGGIGSERADILRNQARARARVARGDLFTDAFQSESDANRRDDEALETRRQYIADLIADQETGNRLLDLEFALLGATNAERERALSTFELKEELMRNGIDLASEEARQALAGNDAQQRNLEILRQQNEVLDEQARIGGQLIDTIFDPQQWDDWGALGKRVLQDLIREMLILAAVNPLKNAAFGSDLPVLGSLGGFFGLAGGSEYTRAGLYEVGEFGKELVRLPRGAQVINANRTRQMERAAAPAAQGTKIFNLQGAVVTEDLLAQINTLGDDVRRVDDSVEDRAIQATTDLNDRTFGLAYARPR